MKHAFTVLGAAALLAVAGFVAVAVADSTGTATASCGSVAPDGTAPCRGQFSVNVPVPTVTQTQTVFVTPTDTPTPTPTRTPTPPPGQFAPGEAMGASNTGYAGDGVTASQLVASGAVTYGSAFNGQTISMHAYSGRVNLTGSNITLKDCSVTITGSSAYGVDVQGSGNTVDHCTVTSPAGGRSYEGVMVEPNATNATVSYNDITLSENLITTYGHGTLIDNNFLHQSCGCGDPDGIEVYGGTSQTIQDNRINYDGLYEAPINVAPYNSYTVQGLLVKGNFLDHGQSIMIIDNQNTACPLSSPGTTSETCLTGLVVEDNAMGGHQCPASNSQCFYIFHPTLNDEGRTFVDSGAANNQVTWPVTGPDVNRWEESADIETSSTPQDGDIVDPNR